MRSMIVAVVGALLLAAPHALAQADAWTVQRHADAGFRVESPTPMTLQESEADENREMRMYTGRIGRLETVVGSLRSVGRRFSHRSDDQIAEDVTRSIAGKEQLIEGPLVIADGAREFTFRNGDFVARVRIIVRARTVLLVGASAADGVDPALLKSEDVQRFLDSVEALPGPESIV